MAPLGSFARPETGLVGRGHFQGKFQNSLPGASGTSGVRQVRKCGQMLDGLSEMPLVRIRGHGPLIHQN